MCIALVLEIDGNEEWWSLREFLEITHETYIAEITGSNQDGYRFQYISGTTNYLSNYYQSRKAAVEALNLALVRSLILNSPLSVFAVEAISDRILYQSEKNIAQFGKKQGQSSYQVLENRKTSWDKQEVFHGQLTIYREVEVVG